VIQYARYLGMDPVADRPLLWVAQQGLDAPLPAEWSEYSSHDGAAYFHNKTTGDTSWTHPTDSHYWSLYRKLKKQHQSMENKEPAPPATARPSSGRPNTHHTCRLARPASQQLLPEVKCPRPQTSRLASQSESSANGGYISNILSLVRTKSLVGSAKKSSKVRKQTKGDVNQTQFGAAGLTKEAEDALLLGGLRLLDTTALAPGGKREFSKAQRRAIFQAANPADPLSGLAHLKPASGDPDLIARPAHALLWVPAAQRKVVKQEYKAKRKKVVKAKSRSSEEEKAEIVATAHLIDVPQVQLSTLYKAFKRHAFSDEQFTNEEWGQLLSLIGMARDDVKERIFAVWSKGRSPVMAKRHLKFPDAAAALCALGVGGRMKQAQAVFRLCDFDNNGSVSRSELLAFAQDQHPLGKHLPRKEKSALFVHVGKLFEKLGVLSSKEEVEMPLWVDRAISDDVVWEHLNAINPYRHYFQDWDESTTGMQNVLNALLLMADSKEQRATVKDRVMALAASIDDSGDGLIDEEEILTALLTLGYQPDEADDIASQSCGEDGMRVEEFIKIFTTIAEGDIKKFAKVEAAYGMNDT